MRRFGEDGFVTEEPHILLSLEPCIADRLVTLVIYAFVFRDILRPGMKRIMRRRVGDIEKIGFILILVFLEKINGPLGEVVGGVPVFFLGSIIREHLPIVETVGPGFTFLACGNAFAGTLFSGIEMIGTALARAVMKAVKTIKATIMKALIGMVLTNRQGTITLCSKKICHGYRILDSF